MAETDRIRVFSRNGTWLIDYGSYAHGYHLTRRAAIQTATNAARRERRELVIEAAASRPLKQQAWANAAERELSALHVSVV